MIICIYLRYVNLVILQYINEKVLLEVGCHSKADSLLIAKQCGLESHVILLVTAYRENGVHVLHVSQGRP